MREVGREQRRLRRAFGAVLLAVVPSAMVAQACVSSSDALNTESDASGDGTLGSDTPTPDVAADNPILPFNDGACATNGGTHDADPDAPDADPGCYYVLPCGIADSATVELVGCEVYSTQPADAALEARALGCVLREGAGCMADVYAPGPNGSVTLDCIDCFGGGGRRPAGLVRSRPARARTELGAYFARMAHDEAASVHAFARMREELEALGAPAALVRAAARSEKDEVRHARVMTALAVAHGARRAPSARVRRRRARRAEAMARENAIEGCVNETYGALVVAWQAAQASDPSLREVFARIAADEARHAALSWAVARFTERRLDARARRRVAAARARAVERLRAAVASSPARSFDERIGRPSPTQAVALLERLSAELSL